MKTKIKDNLPLISIIIPNFNYGQYLESAILSVLNQSYKNFELIIIDGGSTDNSIDVIKKYNNQIKFWVSEKDSGQANAINKGLEFAKGDYVAYLNSDDAYLGDIFLEIFNKRKLTADFIYGDVLIGENIENAKILRSKDNHLLLSSLILFFYRANYIIPSQSVFIKREFLLKYEIAYLNENLHYCMDLDWYCRIAMANPSVKRYSKLGSFFRSNSYTKTKKDGAKMKIEALKIAYKFLPYLKKNEIIQFYKYRLFSLVLNAIYSKKIELNLILLCKIYKRIGFICLRDRRYLGLFKEVF